MLAERIIRRGHTSNCIKSDLGLIVTLRVKFSDSDDEYLLSIMSRGSSSNKVLLRYQFDKADKADETICGITKDAHKIVLNNLDKHSWAELLRFPVEKGTHRFQKCVTKDSIFITSWSIIHGSISACFVYRMAQGVDLNFIFRLGNEDNINFTVSVFGGNTSYLASSHVTVTDKLPLLLSHKKFLKVCRKYANNYVKHYRDNGFQFL